MVNRLKINDNILCRTKIGATEYMVSVFRNDLFDFQFKVSLQPTGKDSVLPTYQLSDYCQVTPNWTMNNLNLISDWITKETK